MTRDFGLPLPLAFTIGLLQCERHMLADKNRHQLDLDQD
jgi:hypothetical protein